MNFNECDKSHSSNDCGLSLYNCKELDLSLVSSQSKFIASSMSSSNGLLAEKTNIRDETSNNASPKTPFFPQSKLKSLNSGRFSTPNIEDSRSDSSHLQETSEDIFDVRDILEDDSVRKLLQTCCTSWLFSRYLLCGNFLAIPILSKHCIFHVIGVRSLSTESKSLTEKSSCNFISQMADQVDRVKDAYFVDHATKVSIHLPRHSASETPLKRASPLLRAIHQSFTAKVGVDLPKLGGLAVEFTALKDIIVTSAVRCNLKRYFWRDVLTLSS